MTVTSQGWEMIRIVTALVALATLAVVLRIVARLKRRLDFGLDDYLCFAALLLLYGMFIELMLCMFFPDRISRRYGVSISSYER